ncbi:Protein bric-a-brac 2 [Frankliniella fusca]|uniref:Protein bric-a-brac 2 n=1 Tax=Frankliniella fusca TaxID=407009 RepID=A0AAE1HI73_9NEOP|nr:Protein bric-a-brac 2 [Frankliniella fusca]
MDNAQFNLRWNNHSFNIVQVFLEQLSTESLVDVTLSCQGQFIKAHKMVLSACSSYFQDLFNLHEAQHPVIILNGIKFHDLKMVVEFMYKGEARVLESELNGILAVAEALQVKGLSNVRSGDKYGNDQSAMSPEACFPTVAMDEDFGSDFQSDSPAVDPLDVSCPFPESSKPGRKRKRVSEVEYKIHPSIHALNTKTGSQKDGSAKLLCSETESLATEISSRRAVAPKPYNSRSSSKVSSSKKTSSPKASASKASSTKPFSSKSNMHQVDPTESTSLKSPSSYDSPKRPTSPAESHSSQTFSDVRSSRSMSPSQSEYQPHAKTSKETSTVSGEKAALSKSPLKVYPAKTSPQKPNCKVSKSSNSSGTFHEIDQGNDEIHESAEADNDDDDLAATIKVEPLFIRDIDDNDTSWDDPSRLVIDLPSEETGVKEGESESPIDKSSCENSETSVKKHKAQNSRKAQLKVKSASELVASSQTLIPSDPLSLEESAGKDVELPKERLGKGDRIPRPPNAFMIFANEWRKKLALENPTESNKQISVRLGMKWKGLNPEKKEEYFCASRRADEEHKQKYPGYFYSPKEARLRKAMRRTARFGPDSTKVSLQQTENSKELNTPEDAFDIAALANASLVVKEELLEEDSQPQNLEEEFLKLVEDGHVGAEIRTDKRQQNCDQKSSVDNQT